MKLSDCTCTILPVIFFLIPSIILSIPVKAESIWLAGETDSVIVTGVEIKDIDKIFQLYDSEKAPGCAVAIFEGGEMAYSKGYGIANLDYGIPISDSTSFYMASVSKQVTAAAAGLLAVRGELDLSSRVNEYIDEWPGWAREVRVHQLFSHTSGLPDLYGLMDIAGISLSNVMDLEDYMQIALRGEALLFEPGTEYSYSNSGYTVLARLVELISDKTFSMFVEKELLKPFGMKSTHFHDDRHRVIPNRAISYQPEGESFRQTYLGNFQGVGPGGLYSTVKDWSRWEAFWNGSLEWEVGGITKGEADELKKMMLIPAVAGDNTLPYGMGLNLGIRKGASINGHSGSFMGFKTDYRRYPEYNIAMVTLCNRGDADPEELNHQLADLVLREYFDSFLAPYEGRYLNEELPVEYKLSVENGNLKLNRRLSPNGYMKEDEKDIWSAGSWDFVFKRNESDEITGFVVSTGRAREVEFLRYEPAQHE